MCEVVVVDHVGDAALSCTKPVQGSKQGLGTLSERLNLLFPVDQPRQAS